MKHPERVEHYLDHIAEAIRRAMEYAREIESLESLEQNRMAQDAIVRNITVIGEAANQIQKVAPEFVSSHPELPWKEIRGMRNVLVHDYFDIGWQRVLDTLKDDLPRLAEVIERTISEAKNEREHTTDISREVSNEERRRLEELEQRIQRWEENRDRDNEHER